jgi:hypothetical protein
VDLKFLNAVKGQEESGEKKRKAPGQENLWREGHT